MKILHVSKKYPEALGGDAIVVSNLQKQQQAAGHIVAIVTSNCDEILAGKHVYKIGLRDTPAQLDAITPRRILSLVLLFFRIFILLRRERPEVIHTHSIDMAFFVSFAARFYHIPIVHTFHIVTFYDESQPALRRKTELWLAKRARLQSATAPNHYDVQKLRGAGLKQAVLLPNGVDLHFWGGAKPSPHNETFTFIAVGRLEHQKGYAHLIEAAASLTHRTSKPFRIAIVGEGSEEAALRGLIRSLHVEKAVTLIGRKSPEEIRTLFAQSDAAVFPSLYETTPLTLLEAWAAGVPAIVTSVGILRDLPSDCGAAFVVPPKDKQALMRAMHTCMTNGEIRKATAAKGTAEVQQYDWPVIARVAEAIYRDSY